MAPNLNSKEVREMKVIDGYLRNGEIKEEIDLLIFDLQISGLITKEQYEEVMMKVDMVL